MTSQGPSYGVLGEDDSDRYTIYAILKNLTGDPNLSCAGKGFGGCGNLINQGADILKGLHAKGCRRFVICADSDGQDPEVMRLKISQRVVGPSGVRDGYCVVIPVHMIEAWILADLDQAVPVWKGETTKWRPKEVANPEAIPYAKEHLKRIGREGGSRPRYDPENDNAIIAAHLDLVRVAKKCPSFEPLREFVQGPRPKMGKI